MSASHTRTTACRARDAKPFSIHQYVIDSLQRAKGTWPRIAEETGMRLRTIEKIARREWENPGVQYVEQLANYFRSTTT